MPIRRSIRRSILTALRNSVILAFLVTALVITKATADDHGGAVHVVNSAPYSEDHDIRRKITSQCKNLGTKLSSFTQSYAKNQGVEVSLVESIDTAGAGRVLQLEINDAVSQGNAFIGHQKFVRVKGTLWENGTRLASFDGQRSSGGGFAAGYKSSCAVLGRCVKALGKDIAAWLADPVDEAELGE